MNATDVPLPATPLQQSLRAAGGAALQRGHALRLSALHATLQARVAAGLPPAGYAQAQRLLAMLAAAQRQLEALPTAHGPGTAAERDPPPGPARLLAAPPMAAFPSVHP